MARPYKTNPTKISCDVCDRGLPHFRGHKHKRSLCRSDNLKTTRLMKIRKVTLDEAIKILREGRNESRWTLKSVKRSGETALDLSQIGSIKFKRTRRIDSDTWNIWLFPSLSSLLLWWPSFIVVFGSSNAWLIFFISFWTWSLDEDRLFHPWRDRFGISTSKTKREGLK